MILKLWIDLDEMYSPDPVLKLCLGIFLIREQKNFKLEEILVGKHFRSPEQCNQYMQKAATHGLPHPFRILLA